MDPGVIRRLDEVVVNRIAAGEIIKRPANALKEMIENSLDAKSTSIQVLAKEGGLKFLQIQDNGTGIRPDDLAIICERFTTSKLQTFEDLSSIATYGFRGEALASISHVAHLTIQTKTRNAQCAYRASYTDSRLNAPPKPVAGNQGTQITVEDLFHNVPQRRQALKSPADEMARISDVVSRYAVHNAGVAFALRKLTAGSSADAGNAAPAVRTVANSTQRQNIAVIYGADVAKDLVEVRLDDTTLRARASGFVTNVNYASKRATMLLFINHRLVESSALKAAIDQTYATYLPKGSHPFVYLSLEIDPANVDVNVHPTKHEVHFLHEDEIIERLKETVERTLVNNNDARRFYAQTLLPGASQPTRDDSEKSSLASTQQTASAVYDKNMVRTDSKVQKLEKFFGNATLLSTTLSGVSMMSDTQQPTLLMDSDEDEAIATQQGPPADVSSVLKPMAARMSQMPTATRRPNVLRKQTKLTSILRMRQRCECECDPELRRILSELTFVGVVDRKRALIQHETKMYLCDTERLAAEIFYQILLYDFENFGGIRLREGLSVRELARLALQSEESGWTEADGTIAELSQSVHEIFVQKRAILREYYAFEISEDGLVLQLPLLLANHTPSMAHLPMYLLRLATEVNWDEEQPFFETFSRETAAYYTIIPMTTDNAAAATKTTDNGCDDGTDGAEPLTWQWYVEHVLYAALKNHLLPPKAFMTNQSFLQVANLANLYKVFERC